MPKYKKLKESKAPEYDENSEYEIEVEDDYYEEDFTNSEKEYIINEASKTFLIREEDEIPEYEDAEISFRRSNTNKFMKVFNVLFFISVIIMVIIATDVISVSRYQTGPFFAIKTKTHNDGGTKEYYGIGYKVIKYNQKEGRKDIQIGLWDMEYFTEPTPIDDIDLAIEFQNNPKQTSEKYYKQYIEITSIVQKNDKRNNKLIMQYTDPDGKYTLDINCTMATNKQKLSTVKENQKVTLRGTISKFKIKTEKKPNQVYFSDCFIK